MRYMRGLNEWLERDVHDRQSEIRGVVARVEQLSHDLRGLQAQGNTHLIFTCVDAYRNVPFFSLSRRASTSTPGY